jgi:hypothetical protein
MADNILINMATSIKSFGKPIFWEYQREPTIQPAPGFDGGGYGQNGDKLSSQVVPESQTNLNPELYKYYSCTDINNIMCLDGPERYRDASRHIHDVVEGVCKDCVTWVQGAAIGRNAGEYKKYYIGDAYVDWHALDVYPYYDCSQKAIVPFDINIEPDWSEAIATSNKPIMFVEFGVSKSQAGEADNSNSCALSNMDRTAGFNDFFSKVKTSHTQLKAFLYWQSNDDFTTGVVPSDIDAQVWKNEMSANPNFWISNVN